MEYRRVIVRYETVMTTNASLSGWNEILAGREDAGKRMGEGLPERLRADPGAVQQSYRQMLAATARVAIDASVGDRAHPVFVPEINLAMNIFQPNADSV